VYQAIIATPLGPIGVVTDAAGRLVSLDYLPPGTDPVEPVAPGVRRVTQALGAYFADPRYRFDVPLAPQGTPHQRRVWDALCTIPAGQSRTYGELAGLVGSAPRAVGQACRRNPIPIIVPCHRVVARGGVGGYSGATEGPELAIKQWLLAHEGCLPRG
jgi:methylated-DNA-[protein]-cysteine S-methyltransferase